MIAKTAIAAALISLSTLAAVPAQASDITVKFGFGAPGYGWSHPGHPVWQRALSPEQVRWILRGHGYSNIAYFDRRGSIYQLRATQHGRGYFLIVNAQSGRILARNRI